ncbi:uncharacterized protein BBOV_IV005870 [Babesia bovis T2Bo]|uniref:Membrane protein, putative n=1 Tax=Babesia bovis TaxID=5865 RepID=A7AQX9_BABBO|nr:uncharacterized protein BBOV_IV005870 [Babesia bovis T2Bo]EDO06948.1 putative integral membrane protein [Babesia bovis T2Bo]|eukprot:XP_001610516.1 hypothetical protein [Babesia bovis T2Bo]
MNVNQSVRPPSHGGWMGLCSLLVALATLFSNVESVAMDRLGNRPLSQPLMSESIEAENVGFTGYPIAAVAEEQDEEKMADNLIKMSNLNSHLNDEDDNEPDDESTVVQITPISISLETKGHARVSESKGNRADGNISYHIYSTTSQQELNPNYQMDIEQQPNPRVISDRMELETPNTNRDQNMEEDTMMPSYDNSYRDNVETEEPAAVNRDTGEYMDANSDGSMTNPSYLETGNTAIPENLKKIVPGFLRRPFGNHENGAWAKIKKAGKVVKNTAKLGVEHIKKAFGDAKKAIKHKITTGKWRPSRVLVDYT